MKKYCENCKRYVSTQLTEKIEVYNVYEDIVKIKAKVLICPECGNEFYSEKFDNDTLIRAYGIYRKKHNLLFPEEIKKIREQYGLSQSDFTTLLNWDNNAISKYENGSIQNKNRNDLLLFLQEPKNMITYLTENKTPLNKKQKTKLLNIAKNLQQDNK